jgi:inner membrane protein
VRRPGCGETPRPRSRKLDTLTHALSGALLARATARTDAPPRSLPRRVAAGFFACAAPDLDFVVGYFGPAAYVLNHRGVTHSVIMLPLWSFLVSWLLSKMLREPGGWRALYGVTALGIAAHIAGDVITSYGTMVLAPFSDWRAALGTTFIIDLWFSGIILAGLLASAFLHRSRKPAIVALTVLVGYVGFQAVLRKQALDFAEEYRKSRGYAGASATAQPRPVSPFNWTVFVTDGELHYYAHINLVRREPREYRTGDGFVTRLDAAYLPLEKAAWVQRGKFGLDAQTRPLAREAWGAPALGFFRWFAELPAFDGMSEQGNCVWFVDLRFLTPGRDTMPFPFGACREHPGAPWRAYEREGTGRTLLR